MLNIFETRNLMHGFGKNDGSFFKSFKVEEHVASIIVRGPGNIMRGQSSSEYSLSAKRSNGSAQTASNNDQFEKVQVGKDQEKAQSEKDSHSKNRGGKKPN